MDSPGGYPPIKTVRVGVSAGLPRNAPQVVTSGAGDQRQAGMPWMKTVVDPFKIGGGGGGMGGCTMPALIAPEHTEVHITWAAGKPSMITGLDAQNGQGAGACGPIMPEGTSISCVMGSAILAAGNIRPPCMRCL